MMIIRYINKSRPVTIIILLPYCMLHGHDFSHKCRPQYCSLCLHKNKSNQHFGQSCCCVLPSRLCQNALNNKATTIWNVCSWSGWRTPHQLACSMTGHKRSTTTQSSGWRSYSVLNTYNTKELICVTVTLTVKSKLFREFDIDFSSTAVIHVSKASRTMA